MLNILFWNINRNKNEDLIVRCIAEHNVDIAVFAEFRDKKSKAMVIDCSKIENDLGNIYAWVTGVEEAGKVLLLANRSISVEQIQQESRYTCYVIDTAVKRYFLAAVHLQDRQNYPTSHRRKETIGELVRDIRKNEESLEIEDTIVIGDFNANPYDEELLYKHAFNAVLFKSVIEENEYTNPRGDRIKRFYNPILHYLSEDTQMYGSHYFDGSDNQPTSYWHCLDQVLLRKSLIGFLEEVSYLKKSTVQTYLLGRDRTPI